MADRNRRQPPATARPNVRRENRPGQNRRRNRPRPRQGGGPLLRRARAETELRYGPEARGLRGLLRGLEGERDTAIQQAAGTAAGVTRAARQAAPQTAAIYGGAGQAMSQINQDVRGALGEAYGGSAAQREAAGAARRLIESGAGAQQELVSRQVDAETGKQFAIQGARQQFLADREKIRGQARDLEAEMGQYLATTYRDLAEAERKYRQEQQRIRISERDSRRMMRATLADITGFDPRTGRPTAETRQQRGEARREEARIDISRGSLQVRQQAEARQRAKDRREARGGGMTPTQRRAFKRDIDKATAAIQQGVYETGEGDDKREIPLTRLYRRAPKKWAPQIRTQLRAAYGNQVADRAMRRLQRRYFGGRRNRRRAVQQTAEAFSNLGFG